MSSKQTPRLARYADKQPTDLQKRFTKWIEKETGVKVDEQSVALSVALRMEFQRSEENQAVLKANREKAVAVKTAKTAPKPKATKAAPVAKAATPTRRKPKADPKVQERIEDAKAAVADAEEHGDTIALDELADANAVRPEPQFEDPKADAAVEKATAPAPKPASRRRTKATMVSGA